MATGLSDQSIVLQEELTCPVCLDVFSDPHLLPCGHNFCKMCLDRLRQLTDQSRFHCPECRNTHRCNKSFQKNFKLANIAFDFRRRHRAAAASTSAQAAKDCVASISTDKQDCVPCDYCRPPTAELSGAGMSTEAGDSQDRRDVQEGASAPNMAVKMCLKCEVSMCPEHIKPHLELWAFREHPLIEPIRDFWKRKCPDHDEIFRYYCLEHQVCVCNACSIEGRHAGHKIKTLRNSMMDIKQKVLDKQLNKVQKKYTMAKSMLNKQTEMEQKNKKFIEDSEGCLARLRQDLLEKVSDFISRLMVCARTHCESSGPTIQKNITRICQELSCLSEVRCSVESLIGESDPFLFIESYKTKGKQCRKLLKKNMFYPEYVDLDRRLLGIIMEEEMQKFLNRDLTFYIFATINLICQHEDIGEESDENENMVGEEVEVEEAGEADDNDLDDGNDLDEGSEEMSGEEEEDEEEGQENEDVELSDTEDESYITEEEEEEDAEEGEDEDQEEGYDDIEDAEEED
ncbi:E3 ubiquitin/ISG15 ligase TRIM25 [Vanacampus margaritifer]